MDVDVDFLLLPGVVLHEFTERRVPLEDGKPGLAIPCDEGNLHPRPAFREQPRRQP